MEKTIQYRLLPETDASFKTDKDLIDIQKTIIYYGNKTIEEINKLCTLIETITIKKDDKGKEIITIPHVKPEIKGLSADPLVRHLQLMKIPKGYKGNDKC